MMNREMTVGQKTIDRLQNLTEQLESGRPLEEILILRAHAVHSQHDEEMTLNGVPGAEAQRGVIKIRKSR
ncbi:hypothetical protein [Gimesia fumaroli]|uniref:Uncharacterized protein n=1 Tax=Gimesia fumaroli TaxID=2527976 RepID=A0A518I975_9PLAN|nr:hypothetical protein [Gimesia fumaroli]QDV49552.1 hypothetical protein Enr17x_15720 [Gimesia fumaroli]